AAAVRVRRRPADLATLAAVRGQARREPGANMIVPADDLFRTAGGGNLELTGPTGAREPLAAGQSGPEMLPLRLNDKAPAEYGRQGCGGEVTVLCEPLPVPASAAIFGIGNIGLELTRILSRHDLDLVVSDSRPEQLEALDG